MVPLTGSCLCADSVMDLDDEEWVDEEGQFVLPVGPPGLDPK